MIDYLVQNLLLLLPAWLNLYLLRHARAGLRMAFSTIAMLLMVTPWQWFSALWTWTAPAPVNFVQPIHMAIEPVLVATANTDVTATTWPTILLWASLAGLLVFFYLNLRHHLFLQTLRRNATRHETLSQQYQQPVLVTRSPHMAFATGWKRPEIWISDNLLQHPAKDIALTHEATHHKLHHPLMQWLLTLLNCLLWWHPLVHLFARQLRRDMELQCDEHCATTLNQETYQRGLAQLLLDTHAPRLGLTWHTRAPSMRERMTHLQRQKLLGHFSKLAITAAVLCFPGGLYLVHAQPVAQVTGDRSEWGVRMENVHLEKALEQVANMGNVHIYLHPDDADHRVNIEVRNVSEVSQLFDALSADAPISWRLRGGVYFVGSESTVDDTKWLPQAIVLRGSGASRFTPQNPGEPDPENAVYLNIKIARFESANNTYTSEFAILVNLGKPAGIRLGHEGIHLSLQVDATPQGDYVSVALHQLDDSGAMHEVGSGSEQISYQDDIQFTWQNGIVKNELSITPKPYQHPAS